MNFQLTIFFSFALVAGLYGIRQKRIVGGENGDIISFPYLVSIRRYSTRAHFCAGAILTEMHILTAAHCMVDKKPYTDIRVYTGCSSSVLTTGNSFHIKDVKLHPKYSLDFKDSGRFHNDIAVITVQGLIPFNQVQRKIGLTTNDAIVNNEAIFAGWGYLATNAGVMSDQLQQTPMVILDYETCRHAIPFIDVDEMCAFKCAGVGACTGDSGGPLVSNNEIVGIASYVIPCAKGLPDVYTNVYRYLDFINPIIGIKTRKKSR